MFGVYVGILSVQEITECRSTDNHSIELLLQYLIKCYWSEKFELPCTCQSTLRSSGSKLVISNMQLKVLNLFQIISDC